MEQHSFSETFVQIFMMATAMTTTVLFVAMVIRRKIQKKRYYSRSDVTTPIEGSVDELNELDATASPWTNDQRRKLQDTKDLVGRYNTFDGYSDIYVEDLMSLLRKSGIECDFVFQETLPMGVGPAIVTRIGTYEVFADRSKVDEALKLIEEFKKR
jgi:hypothetical protein